MAGKTPKPERPCTSGRSSRVTLHVAVFIRLGRRPVVLPISGTHDAGVQPSRAYPPLVQLGMEEYKDKVVRALTTLGCMQDGALLSRGHKFVLLHDRDPSHQGSVFKQWQEEVGLKVVVLPPSCPDLTPMDATFFGSVMMQWRRGYIQNKLGWLDKVQLFMELLQKTLPGLHIEHWQAAVKACVQERGGHVERRLGRRHS